VGTLLLLAVALVGGPALVVLTFLTTRALVGGGGRRAGAAAGLAVVLVALGAYVALGLGGARAYPDTACARHRPPAFGEGSSTVQSAGLWPPGLQCRFESRAGVATYRDGFLIWVAVAMTAVFAATMGLVVAGYRRGDEIVHFWL